jgi:uroporphyrinogen-III decarboxylase
LKPPLDSAGSADHRFVKEGFNRLEMALKGIPDRVPVFAQVHELAMKESGLDAREFFSSPQGLVSAILSTVQKCNLDVPFLDYDVYNIEIEAIGQKIIYSRHYPPDVDRTDPLIKCWNDLKKIQKPDFTSDGRFPMVVEMNTLFRESIGRDPTLNFCAPFSMAASIRGIETLVMDIMTNPAFAKELFNRLTEDVIIPWILFLKDQFPTAPGICGSDAMASLPIVNLDILKDWIIPYVLRLREICGPQVYVPNWVGESYLPKPQEFLELKLKVCPDFLEGQDPDVAKIGPEVYKAFAEKNNVALVLGIGAGFLASSHPMEIAERVKQYIEIGGKNGRFCLYLCNIGSTTPLENVKAVVDAVHKHGVYMKSEL